VEGELRYNMVGPKLVGIIHKKPKEGGISAVGGTGSIYTYYGPDEAKFSNLTTNFLTKDIDSVMPSLGLPDEPIPLWWTTDFILASPEGTAAEDEKWIVGEFNCSCVGISKCLPAYCKDDTPNACWNDIPAEDKEVAKKYGDMMGDVALTILSKCRERVIMVLFGPPGAGKGTHSPMIVEKMNTPSLSTGDMLREAVAAGTEVGLKAKAVMESGGLVSDDIVVGIIKDRITAKDCSLGFILDGFPRTVEQAQALDAMLAESKEKVSKIIEFQVPDEVLTERICGRWIHKASGRSYHTKFAPPKSYDGSSAPTTENMKDDETGEALMQRADDNEDSLKKRLQGYHDQTIPILKHYEGAAGCSICLANANQEIEKVQAEIASALK